MRSIRGYHRPQTLGEALALLERPGVSSRVLAGGTSLNATAHGEPFEVVDLQALALDSLTADAESIQIGAMTRLQDVVDHDGTPPLLRELAHREGPNTIRNAATIGGVVAAADPESELVAGLLVHEATVTLATGGGTSDVPLAAVLGDASALSSAVITTVTVAADGVSAADRTGRTPADRSIVAVIGRRTAEGKTLFAATGVAETPVLIEPDEIGGLEPPGDFRGTPGYRRALLGVLLGRVVARLEEQA